MNATLTQSVVRSIVPSFGRVKIPFLISFKWNIFQNKCHRTSTEQHTLIASFKALVICIHFNFSKFSNTTTTNERTIAMAKMNAIDAGLFDVRLHFVAIQKNILWCTFHNSPISKNKKFKKKHTKKKQGMRNKTIQNNETRQTNETKQKTGLKHKKLDKLCLLATWNWIKILS